MVRFPRHSVSGSTLLGLTWDSWCGKGTAPGCAWCLRWAMLLRGFRLFGVALHREPKGTKRQILLEAGASVIPVKGALPPLFLAVLHRHRTNVQLLLDAQADPWQEITIASVLCHSLEWYGYPARKEVFNAVQAAALQNTEDTVIDILQRASSPSDVVRSEQLSQVRNKFTALTDRATAILKQIVWKYQHIIEKQSRQTNFTTFRWRRILDGLSLPVQLREPYWVYSSCQTISSVVS